MFEIKSPRARFPEKTRVLGYSNKKPSENRVSREDGYSGEKRRSFRRKGFRANECSSEKRQIPRRIRLREVHWRAIIL
jgi:hypothetical protein